MATKADLELTARVAREINAAYLRGRVKALFSKETGHNGPVRIRLRSRSIQNGNAWRSLGESGGLYRLRPLAN